MAHPNSVTHLLAMMAESFNLAEIRTLCFELGVRYDALGENLGLTARIVALIETLQRRQGISALLPALRKHRPLLDWPDISDSDLALWLDDRQTSSPPATKPTINIGGNIHAGNVNIGGTQKFDGPLTFDLRGAFQKPDDNQPDSEKE
jgi:hypothetical protein